MFDAVMLSLIAIGLVVAFWGQFWSKLLQLTILCAVVESDYAWGWNSTGNGMVPVVIGTVLAALLTAIYIEIRIGKPKASWKAYVENRHKDLRSLTALIRRLPKLR